MRRSRCRAPKCKIRTEGRAKALAQPPNVVLLVFDTMRRDALGAYGGTAATPNFDSFCREATVYPNCISPSPWTIPSHVSLFSGKYPSQHGVHETRDRKVIDLVGMPEGVKGKMLAESLKGMGYQTVGFPANPMLTAKPGFDRGFDSFSANFKRVVSPEEAALVKEAVEEGKSKPRNRVEVRKKRAVREAPQALLQPEADKQVQEELRLPEGKGWESPARADARDKVGAAILPLRQFHGEPRPLCRLRARRRQQGSIPFCRRRRPLRIQDDRRGGDAAHQSGVLRERDPS